MIRLLNDAVLRQVRFFFHKCVPIMLAVLVALPSCKAIAADSDPNIDALIQAVESFSLEHGSIEEAITANLKSASQAREAQAAEMHALSERLIQLRRLGELLGLEIPENLKQIDVSAISTDEPNADTPLQKATSDDRVNFNRDIRPILSNHCYECHGPDEATRKAKLRLDVRNEAFASRGNGPALIIPGKPEESELFKRISATDQDDIMPPPAMGKPLTEKQIELFRAWIEQGASWNELWSLVPPTRPARPDVSDTSWPINAVDHFVLARLEREGLKPSESADKNKLIRRLSFDLIGLPPTPEEVDEFLWDTSPDAYERLVDRLLERPQFGEHMAVNWCDLARYADSDGYHIDYNKTMWPWRDWVINAFNANKPFDEFVIEQLAGDLLENPTTDQLIATGFNRNGMTTTEGGADANEYLAKYAVDRVNTTSTVFLGLTMACAECHSHKYDPITQKEYYQFYDFFNRIPESGLDKDPAPPYIELPTEEQTARLASLDQEISEFKARLDPMLSAPDITYDLAQQAWERDQSSNLGQPAKLDWTPWHSIGPWVGPSAELAFGLSYPPEREIDYAATYQRGKLKWAERPEFEDGKVHSLGDTEFGSIYLHRKVTSSRKTRIPIFLGSDDSIKVWINGELVHSNRIDRGVVPNDDVVEINLNEGANEVLLKVVNIAGGQGFYFSSQGEGGDELKAIHAILKWPPWERTPEEIVKVRRYWRELFVEDLRELRALINEKETERKKTKGEILTTRIMKDAPEPRATHILIRGDYLNKGEVVHANVPSSLPPLPAGSENNRLGLAHWLTAPEHPLLARITVNRFWQEIFGIGLVKTSEDFGSQGELPSHPELLDWLAVEFRESGWDIKGILKTIVMSQTYRQDSKFNQEDFTRDPENRLLARGPRFRIDAEVVRDNALAIAGLYEADRPVGGPSVNPYQPEGLWREKAIGGGAGADYTAAEGRDNHRRGLYTFWKRSVAYPQFMSFDAPSREVCTVRRDRTNTPLQVFVTLNETTYVEAARHFALRLLKEAPASTEDRIEYAYRIALARMPRDSETKTLAELYNESIALWSKDIAGARKFLSQGATGLPEGLDDAANNEKTAELAAWSTVASIVLNLDETMTKE